MKKYNETVSLEYRVYKSFEGKYFIGHTPILRLSCGSNSWGGLINPRNSNVNLYVNTFTTTNFSDVTFSSQIWLNSTPIGDIETSDCVSIANTAIRCHRKQSKVKIQYAENISSSLIDGESIFRRIAEANSTVVGNYYGKIIIPPGGSFIIFLSSSDTKPIESEVAFGWWEDKITEEKSSYYYDYHCW